MKGNKTTHVKYQLVIYAVYVVGIIFTNIRLVKASMVPVNAPAAETILTPQSHIHKGSTNVISDVNPNPKASERENAIKRLKALLDASIERYEDGEYINSNEKSKINSRNVRQIYFEQYSTIEKTEQPALNSVKNK
ncbi:hypothetical protein NEPAR04_2452 [Nematocida parisii]|nr:hypothetical protein NEPAR03_2432 [Nematocida parisii]KAI5131429.1 hypothetical protein NEPAR08_2451 [Nematocida parisii]KAI5145440.1 hypothetical protein NEPAR04_2452 [Nematocida parisii]